MEKQFEILEKTRLQVLEQLQGLSTEQLNEIPAGFNNNIIWNVAHLIAAQQGVCYLRPGFELRVAEKYFNLYKPGSKPEAFVTAEEVQDICELLLTSLAQFKSDYENKVITSYVPWTTRYGVALDTIEDAIRFLPFHEGLHLGYILALKRALSKVEIPSAH
jgi:hypothetical protein